MTTRLLAYAAPPHHGALLLGDRRIGKTSLLNAIQGPLIDAGHLVVRVSAETDSLERFADSLLTALRASAGPNWAFGMEGQITVNVGVAAITVRGQAIRGKEIVEHDLFSLCEQSARSRGPYRVVFLLDEITVLATQLARDDPDRAREFLRMLRRARQSSSRIAMFLSGSIGLHHALPDEVEVNDLQRVHVDVLPRSDALVLARGLIRGGELNVTSETGVADTMVELTHGFPFFIHGLAQELQNRGGSISSEDVQAAFSRCLAEDSWNVRHYRARIDDYYQEDAFVALALLDLIALTDHPIGVDELMEVAPVAIHAVSRDDIMSVLARLEADHYLRRVGNKNTMANGLMRAFWLHLRRLT